MCERLAALLTVLSLIAAPAAAVEAPSPVTILDLPFKATQLRGPGSEVSLAAATSGVIPLAKPKPTTADPKAAKADAPDAGAVVVVWGTDGGAVLTLENGAVKTTLIGAEAAEGLAAAETPRVAVPGSRRAVSGAISAYFTGPLRATGQAGGLTIRERQPIGVTAEPKTVPVATVTVAPGADTVFAARKPRIATLDGNPAILAVTSDAQGGSALDVLAKRGDAWTIVARTPVQPGATPLVVATVADLTGKGRPQIATLRAKDSGGTLQLWSYGDGTLGLLQEADGFAMPTAADDAELATVISQGASKKLVLPIADRGALAFVTAAGELRETTRIALPAPAQSGVAALGRDSETRVLAGLADGRVAVVTPPSE